MQKLGQREKAESEETRHQSRVPLEVRQHDDPQATAAEGEVETVAVGEAAGGADVCVHAASWVRGKEAA